MAISMAAPRPARKACELPPKACGGKLKARAALKWLSPAAITEEWRQSRRQKDSEPACRRLRCAGIGAKARAGIRQSPQKWHLSPECEIRNGPGTAVQVRLPSTFYQGVDDQERAKRKRRNAPARRNLTRSKAAR